MVWLIIVGMLVLVVVAVLRDGEPAFPTKARRRTGRRGRLSVVEAVDDSAPSVFAGSWHDDADCGTTSDSGSSDSCSDSSSSSD